MADRINYQAPTILPNTMPQVVTDDGTAEYANTLANSFLTTAGNAHKRQLDADLQRAQVEGQKHGYDGGKNFRPIKSGSMFSRTYNDSGLTTATTRMSMDAQKAVKGYYSKNSANPDGLASSLKKYGEEYLAELPEEMQTPFQMNFDRLASTAIEQAKDNLTRIRQQEAQAQFEMYDEEMQNSIEMFGADAFKDGSVGTMAQLSLRDLRKQYAEVLMQHGPSAAYSVGGYSVKSGGGRSGAFTPVEIAKKLKEFDKRILEASVFGNFKQEVEAGRGIDAYMTFVNGSQQITTIDDKGKASSMSVSDLLSNKEMDSISDKMRSFMGGIMSLEEAVDKKQDRARDDYNDEWVRRGRDIALQVKEDANGREYIAGGDPAALSTYVSAALSDPMIDPKSVDQLRALQTELGNGQFDDPIIVNQANVDIATGSIASYQQVPKEGVSDATRVRMYETIDSRNKGQHWTNSNRYKIAEQYADAVLAPEKSAGFSLANPNEAAAADRAEWNKRMIEETLAAEAAGLLPQNSNAMPVDKQFDFVSRGKMIADEIANKRNPPELPPAVKEIDAQIDTLREQMLDKQYRSKADELQKQYKTLQEKRKQLMESK